MMAGLPSPLSLRWRGVSLLTPRLPPGAAGLSYPDKCWLASRLLVTLQAAFLLQRLLNQARAESHRLGGKEEGPGCWRAHRSWRRAGAGIKSQGRRRWGR